MEHELQQLQIKARRQLAQTTASRREGKRKS
jgi:hypothetical protein